MRYENKTISQMLAEHGMDVDSLPTSQLIEIMDLQIGILALQIRSLPKYFSDLAKKNPDNEKQIADLSIKMEEFCKRIANDR